MNTMNHRGYSLLEMIVSVGVFSVIMLAATGAYLTLINLDRQARATTDVVTNLSFAVDSMSRQIRTGTNYKCNNNSSVPNCTLSPADLFGFIDSNARTVTYSIDEGQLIVTTGGVSAALTDPRVEILALNFYVRGVGDGDGIQPQVTMTIKGKIPTKTGQDAEFTVQGAATQRLIEL